MTRVAQIPGPEQVPTGMVHVGWRCTAPGHECLKSLGQVEQHDGSEVWLTAGNHRAHWVPVYADAAALAITALEDLARAGVAEMVAAFKQSTPPHLQPGGLPELGRQVLDKFGRVGDEALEDHIRRGWFAGKD